MSEPLATVRNARELCDAFRARVDQLNISMETLDEIAGLPIRYSAKLLAPVPVKQFGPMSLDAMLGALGLRLGVFEDPEQMARVRDRMVERKRRDAPKQSGAVSFFLTLRKLKQRGRNGGKNSRKYMTRAKARKLARKAGIAGAKARWHKPRVVEVKGSGRATHHAISAPSNPSAHGPDRSRRARTNSGQAAGTPAPVPPLPKA